MTQLKNIISTTEARRRIFELTDAVQTPGTRFVLTENGKSKAVILSAEEYESWQETIETLMEDPDLPQLMKKLEQDTAKRDFSDYIPLEDVIKEMGYSVAEQKGEYVLRRTVHQGSKKRTRQTSRKNSK